MFRRILMVNAVLVCGAFAQSNPRNGLQVIQSPGEIFTLAGTDQQIAVENPTGGSRLSDVGTDKVRNSNVAAMSNPRLLVSKTASVSGQNVCGAIRITNFGMAPVTVTAIKDSLEVHFFNNIPPPGLTAGSTSNWFKVSDVPVTLPGPIAPRKTATINYCFSLCQAADYFGANSMRNVVAVFVGTHWFGARSNSFNPPFLDCRACCLSDGSCTDTVPLSCASRGGVSQGSGTDCATTECPQACCRPGDSCTDEGPRACQVAGGEPRGPGTSCASTQCCNPPGLPCGTDVRCCGGHACDSGTCCVRMADSGCASQSDCCEEDGTAICDAGRCCAPNRAPDSCEDAGDCCNTGATCLGGTCCIALGDSGCTNLVGNDCCDSFGAVVCEAGKCCAPTGLDDSCFVDADCCDPNATCNGGTCCVRLAESTCGDASDCCDDDFGTIICAAGRCCAPNRAPDSCQNVADCCDANATCSSGTCCIALGDSGCTNLVGTDCCETFGAVICETGKCCAPTGADDSCFVDSDCCEPNATCNGGACCIPTGGTGCSFNECCETVCVEGTCCNPSGLSCSSVDECCDGLSCIGSECCLPSGSSCGTFDTCCGGTFCIGGICCIPSGESCNSEVDCCGNAICGGSRCCMPTFGGCSQDVECCSGLCTSGRCEGVSAP